MCMVKCDKVNLGCFMGAVWTIKGCLDMEVIP